MKNKTLDKAIMVFLLLSIISGLLLLGLNITGNSTYNINDSITKPLCTSDDECTNNDEVCCYFYDKNAGICYPANDCNKVYEETKNIPKLTNLTYEKRVNENSNENIYKILSYFFATSSIITLILICIKLLYKKSKSKKKSKK